MNQDSPAVTRLTDEVTRVTAVMCEAEPSAHRSPSVREIAGDTGNDLTERAQALVEGAQRVERWTDLLLWAQELQGSRKETLPSLHTSSSHSEPSSFLSAVGSACLPSKSATVEDEAAGQSPDPTAETLTERLPVGGSSAWGSLTRGSFSEASRIEMLRLAHRPFRSPGLSTDRPRTGS